MTFGLMYAFAENFVLPLSHDEVVHGKGSLLARMPGDAWQQFATLRALLRASCGRIRARSCCSWARSSRRAASGISTPGSTGRCSTIDWHRGVQALVRDCNRAYRALRALHERDCEPDGFRWIVVDDAEQSVFAWLRIGGDGAPPVAVVANFTPVPRDGYRIGLPRAGTLARDPQHRRRGLRRIGPRQRRRRRGATPARCHGHPCSADDHAAAARARSGSSTTAA